MNSRCKKKITPICQHFKLPLEQILHLAFVQSQSHIGYTQSCKLKGARKGVWMWHMTVCTTTLAGHSLPSSWPGPTAPCPAPAAAQEGQPCRHHGQEGPGRQALLWGRRALPSREALPGPTALSAQGRFQNLPLDADIAVTLPAQRDVHSWDGSLILSVCHKPLLTSCSQVTVADSDTNSRVTAWSHSTDSPSAAKTNTSCWSLRWGQH